MTQNKVIETEMWEPNPDKPGTVRFVKTRRATEVFDELVVAMRKNNMMPDEYFSLSASVNKTDELPRDAEFIAFASWGASEGVYIDVQMLVAGQRMTFAVGKSLGETEADYDRMQAIAGFIYKSFAGFGHQSVANSPVGTSDDEEEGDAI